MAPVFEGATLADELVEHVLPVAGDAREQHVVMGPGDHGDGVDLHVADPLQGLADARDTGAELAGAAQALAAQGQSAQAGSARGAGHRLCRGALAKADSARGRIIARVAGRRRVLFRCSSRVRGRVAGAAPGTRRLIVMGIAGL